MGSSSRPAAAKSSKEKERFDSSPAGRSDGCHEEKRAPEINDATAFREEVKAQFGEQSETYKEFVRIMSGFQHRTIKIKLVLAAMKRLFSSSPEFIDGFNNFLPIGWEITTEPPREGRDECTRFLNKLKGRFPNDENRICSSFVRIMSMFQERRMSRRDVRKEVTALFSAHADLLEEFTRLLSGANRNPGCSDGDVVAPHAASPLVMILAEGVKRVEVDDPEHGRKRPHVRNERIRGEAAASESMMSDGEVVEVVAPLDTLNMKRCTPSYCMLPKNYRLPVASYSTELDKSVLNSTAVLTSNRQR